MTSSPAELSRLGLLPGHGEIEPNRLAHRFAAVTQASGLVVFWATFGATLFAIAGISLIPRQQSFDTGAARDVRRLAAIGYEAHFSGPLPSDCRVGCDGFELTKAATADEVVHDAGKYWIDADRGLVRWSPRTDVTRAPDAVPIAVVVVPGAMTVPLQKDLLCFWIPAIVLVIAGLIVALIGSRRPVHSSWPVETLLARASLPFSRNIPSPTPWRTVLVLAVGIGLGFALIPDWNRLVTCADSRSYVEHSPIRSPLTAWWIAAFDREHDVPRIGSLPVDGRTVSHWGASDRYGPLVWAWKVLLVVSLCVFTWWLASIVPWWFAAPLILAAVAFDASRAPWSTGMTGYLDVLLSEPLSYALMFLLLASVCAYFSRPSWTYGVAIAITLNLLILARPASVTFVSVIGCVWLLDWRRGGLGVAFRRAGGIAILTAGGILLHCTRNLAEYGQFRQHAFAGMNLMTTALQVVDADDTNAFSDPKLRQYASLVVRDALAKRQASFDAAAADANCWQIAVPAFEAVYGVTAAERPFLADDVLTRVAREFIGRHPREFARLAASSFWNGFWRSAIHLPLLLTFAAGGWLFLRSGDWRFLFVACLAGLPFVGVLPACLTNYPIDRYRSLTLFAEFCSLPLFVGVVLSAAKEKSRVSGWKQDNVPRDFPAIRVVSSAATPQCDCVEPSHSCV
jgi:hypothetical protein